MAKVKAVKVPMIRQSAQQIWLAGLGAFAMAGEEGGKLFTHLVKRGQQVEKLNKARLQKTLARIEKAGVGAREMARETVGKLTTPFDVATTAALRQFGVPTRKEIVTLTKRVEELTRTVQKGKGKKPVHTPEPVEVA